MEKQPCRTKTLKIVSRSLIGGVAALALAASLMMTTRSRVVGQTQPVGEFEMQTDLGVC